MPPVAHAPAAPARSHQSGSDDAIARLSRLRAAVWPVVCSANWFDACFVALAPKAMAGEASPIQTLDQIRLYPPGGSPAVVENQPTTMRQCRSCGDRWYPPQYVRGDGCCEDCHAQRQIPAAFANTDHQTHQSTTSSPSAMAIHQLQRTRGRLLECPLPAEPSLPARQTVACGSSTQGKPLTDQRKMAHTWLSFMTVRDSVSLVPSPHGTPGGISVNLA